MSGLHTSGPWKVGRNGIYVYGADDLAVIHVADTSIPRDDAEMGANARLIALAPELLALAYQYRSDLNYPVSGHSKERRLAAIGAVLAKLGGDS